MQTDVRRVGRGHDVLAILNANARKTTDAAVAALRGVLPAADVMHTRCIEEVEDTLAKYDVAQRPLLLCGGGDGTVSALLSRLEQVDRTPIGVLRLGTGNGLANVLGSGSYRALVDRLPGLALPPPTRRFDLVAVEGRPSPFAGPGWDARILTDYRRNFTERTGRARRFHESFAGYLWALFTITIPEEHKLLKAHGQPEVEVTNLGAPAMLADEQGRPVPMPGGETGAVLYRGPSSVASCATSPEWGFRFRAHPNAQVMPGWLNLRVYDRPILEAVRNMGALWRGKHPQPGMHDLFVQRVRMRFSRPVPFQIGGDPVGLREEVEMSIAPTAVQLVDWPTAFGAPARA